MKKLTSLFILISLLVGCISGELSEESKLYKRDSENGVSNWIKNYAKYPKSYESVSFSEFSQSYSSSNGKKIPNSDNYVIKHTHKLLNQDSVMETFSGYFILENDFDVNIIEIERSNSIGGAFPPQTQTWIDKFGRKINKQDSLYLDKKGEQLKERIIREVKIAIDEDNVTSGNVEELQNIIDSL